MYVSYEALQEKSLLKRQIFVTETMVKAYNGIWREAGTFIKKDTMDAIQKNKYWCQGYPPSCLYLTIKSRMALASTLTQYCRALSSGWLRKKQFQAP